MDPVTSARARLELPEHVDIDQYRSLTDLMLRACDEFGGRPAVTCLGHTLTYQQLHDHARNFAAYLQHHTNLEHGDRIAIQLPNVLQYHVAFLGAMMAGLVVVNTNPLYTHRELDHQFNDGGVRALVVLANVAHQVEKVLPSTGIGRVIVTEVADLHSPLKRFVINKAARYIKRMVPKFDIPGHVRFCDALRIGAGEELKQCRSNHDDIAMLQYTGGTTGLAKGAMLTHRNLVANAVQTKAVFETFGLQVGGEVEILPLPLYHIFAFMASINCIMLGNQIVLIPNPRDLDGFIKTLRRHRFSLFVGLNTLFVGLCNRSEFAALDFSHLKMTLSGGMALTRAAGERWREITGGEICEGYGLTETSPVVSVNPGTGNQPGTIGVPVPDTEVRIIDEQDHDLDTGGPGELLVRGPQVMKGYWNLPDETAAAIVGDGWLRTGDIAVLQPDGYLRIVDRKKDMILVSGFNVFPNEVEDVLASHPDVSEAAVIGVYDDTTGEAVKAFIVRHTERLSVDDIRDYCHERLAGYKVPRYVEFCDELPKSNVGKVLRRSLREQEAGA